jgi:hypothetical protein
MEIGIVSTIIHGPLVVTESEIADFGGNRSVGWRDFRRAIVPGAILQGVIIREAIDQGAVVWGQLKGEVVQQGASNYQQGAIVLDPAWATPPWA